MQDVPEPPPRRLVADLYLLPPARERREDARARAPRPEQDWFNIQVVRRSDGRVRAVALLSRDERRELAQVVRDEELHPSASFT